MNVRVAIGLSFAIATLACKEADAGPLPPYYDDEGDPCHTDFKKRCIGADQLFHCTERIWTVSRCEDVCVAQSPAFVSGECVVGEYVEECECRLADPAGCTPGELRCSDEATIGKCDDAQHWVEHACADLCPEEQPALGCQTEPLACRCGL